MKNTIFPEDEGGPEKKSRPLKYPMIPGETKEDRKRRLMAENRRKWRAANPEKAREAARNRYAANPEKAREAAKDLTMLLSQIQK